MRQIKFRYYNGNELCPIKLGEDWWDMPDNIEFQQFTGLLDKNGKEIYEGDILKYTTKRGVTHYWTVYWDQNNCRFKMFLKGEENFPQSFDKERADGHEVIGNIYD